jgi:hypothetical protein
LEGFPLAGNQSGMPRRLTALVLLGALAACTDRGPLSGPTLEPLDVRVEGAWLRDRRGRVVLLRGVTLPSVEWGRYVEQPDGPTEADFAGYERAGLNVVRVVFSWPALEPMPGSFDHGYFMERVNPVIRLAAKHGMLVVLAATGLLGDRPNAVCDLLSGEAGDPGLRERFLVGWQLAIRFYKADRRVVGFDLLDEPREEPCPDGTSGELLFGLYREVARELRRRGAIQSLFFEPTVRPDALMPRKIPGPRIAAAFAPHVVSQTFGPPPGGRTAAIARAYAEGTALARANALLFFVGAIGADEPPRADGFRPTSADFARESFDALDRYLAGGTLVLAGEREPHPPDAAATLAAVRRPWARRIAGIPTAMRLDAESRSFLLAFRDDPARRVADPTEVFVPRGYYPEGFTVQVLPSGRSHYDEHSERLLVYRSDAAGHAVRIDPRRED